VSGQGRGESGGGRLLALFPLGTVLFPGVLLPLHVFEERYRRMVRDLLEADHEQRELGVVAIREGREVGADGLRALHPVGCVARLRRVDPYADGRFDIVCVGTTRFRFSGDEPLDDSRAYLRGRVETLPEPAGSDPLGVAAAVRRHFDDYRRALGQDPDAGDTDPLPDDPHLLSYLVAATMVLDLRDRQRLLEAPDTTARLRAQARLLRRETALLGQLPSLPGIELTRVAASPNSALGWHARKGRAARPRLSR
jgi:Lon protease-like protein